MLLIFMAIGSFFEAIMNVLAIPLIPFFQLGSIGNLIFGEIEDVIENGK